MSISDEAVPLVEAPAQAIVEAPAQATVEAPAQAAAEESAQGTIQPSWWMRSRRGAGAVALLLFGFWLGARLGPLTALGSGDGLSQGTWLPAPAPAQAYIGGAVRHPGLYRLAPHERVAGLLRQAGGPTSGADLSRLALAASVHDGESITVPLRHPGCAPGHNS